MTKSAPGEWLNDSPPTYRVTRGCSRVRYIFRGCRGSHNLLAYRKDRPDCEPAHLDDQAAPRRGLNLRDAGVWWLVGGCAIGLLACEVAVRMGWVIG